MTPTGPHNVDRLSPGFIISAGTQVVLKVAKPLAGTDDVRKPGSVAASDVPLEP